MSKFIFTDRATKGEIYVAEVTAEELEEVHGGDLTKLYEEYDAEMHKVKYEG